MSEPSVDIIAQRCLLCTHHAVKGGGEVGQGSGLSPQARSRGRDSRSGNHEVQLFPDHVSCTIIPVTYGYAPITKSDHDEKNLETQPYALERHGGRAGSS